MIFTRKKWLRWGIFSLTLQCGTTISYAQSFDQDYLKWKAEQQAWDERIAPSKHLHSKSSSAQNLSGSSVHQISLNQANLEQLQQLHGVGLKKAQAILAYRQKQGSFKHIEEVQHVPGIGPVLFQKNKARLKL